MPSKYQKELKKLFLSRRRYLPLRPAENTQDRLSRRSIRERNLGSRGKLLHLREKTWSDPKLKSLSPVPFSPSSPTGEANQKIITLDVNNALHYYSSVIVSFKDADTEALAAGRRVKRFQTIEKVARRKLRQLQIAGRIGDLRVPPGNRLEALRGDRTGQYSIRVNDRFRICFRWTTAGAKDVEIVDYH